MGTDGEFPHLDKEHAFFKIKTVALIGTYLTPNIQGQGALHIDLDGLNTVYAWPRGWHRLALHCIRVVVAF